MTPRTTRETTANLPTHGSFVVGALLGLLAVSNLTQGLTNQILPINLGLASIVLTAIAVLTRRPREKAHGLGPLLLMGVVIALGMIAPALNPSASQKRTLIIGAVLAPAVVAAMASTRWDFRARANHTMKGFIATFVILSLLTMALMAVSPAAEGQLTGRLYPEGMNAIAAGRLLCAAALLTFLGIFAVTQPMIRVALAGMSAMFVVGALLTASRGPLLALGVSVVFALLASRRFVSGKVRASAITLIVGMLFVILRQGIELDDRLASAGSTGREGLQATAWRTMTEQPFGIGWGNLYNYLSGSDAITSQGYDQYPHNVLLEVGSEAGIIGLLILIFILTRAAKTPGLRDSPEGLALAAVSVYAFTGAMFSSDIIGNRLCWVLLGILLGCSIVRANATQSGRTESEPSAPLRTTDSRPRLDKPLRPPRATR